MAHLRRLAAARRQVQPAGRLHQLLRERLPLSTDPFGLLLTRGCRREQGKWPDPDGLRATPRGEAGTPGNNGTKLAGINFPGHFSAFPEIYYP